MKRYQIFVSSTYTDLIEERQAVIHAILSLRHIPIGMEQFVAMDDEQFSYIKRLIDDTDYYVLIIGNRYGSVTDDGISYTEKEFDYAVKKGVPVLAFVHSNPEIFPVAKSEISVEANERLMAFREKVKLSRLVCLRGWDNPDALVKDVVISLTNNFHDHPRPGWERVGSYETTELLEQINNLRIENEELRIKADNSAVVHRTMDKLKEFQWESSIQLQGKAMFPNGEYIELPVDLTWIQLFDILGPYLMAKHSDGDIKYYLQYSIWGKEGLDFQIADSQFERIMFTFYQIGAVRVEPMDHYKYITLTVEGSNYLASFAQHDSVDNVLEELQESVRRLKRDATCGQQKCREFIRQLSDFASNPESFNYVGKTLISIRVFLDEQDFFPENTKMTVKQLIEDILKDASQSERIEMGMLDPVFNPYKILQIVELLESAATI